MVSDDEQLHALVVRDVLTMLANESQRNASPPEFALRIHRHVAHLVGRDDPYACLKRMSNEVALAALPRLHALIDASEDRLSTAVRLAIAANTLDAGMNAVHLPTAQGDQAVRAAANTLAATLELSMQEPLHGDLGAFRDALASAHRILFLTDNSGEIVIDRLLIEQLPREHLTIAVRGGPVLNDATRDDALVAGLHALAPVMDNGSNAPGTLVSDCAAAFRRALRDADVVVAKGMGNYESLRDEAGVFFFLLKVKCAVVAQHTSLPLNGHALLRSQA